MDDWIDYYDSAHTIYVSKAHRSTHFQIIAADIAAYIPHADATVLDYSCGEALSAAQVGHACSRLILAEPASRVRDRLAARFSDHDNIKVMSLDDLEAMPDASIDYAVMISVAQYMTPAELDNAIALMSRVVKCGGRFLLGDVLHPEVGTHSDVMALLRLGAKHGFLKDALTGLVRIALSDYSRLRQRIGLQRYPEGVIVDKLASADFNAARTPANVGYNPARMTFLATRNPRQEPAQNRHQSLKMSVHEWPAGLSWLRNLV